MKRMICVSLLLLPLAVQSQTPDDSYVEGGLSIVDPPGRLGGSDTGVQVRGSHALDEQLFLRGGLQSNRFSTRVGSPGNRRRVSVDRDLLWFGVGIRIPTEQDLDLYGAGDILYDAGDADEAGVRLEGGARAALPPAWDVAGGLRVARIDGDTNAQIFGNAFYTFAPQFSAGAELAIGDFDEAMLGVRYSF